MRRRRRGVVVALMSVLAGAMLTLGGCGVPIQTDPQPLPSDVVPRVP